MASDIDMPWTSGLDIWKIPLKERARGESVDAVYPMTNVVGKSSIENLSGAGSKKIRGQSCGFCRSHFP